MRSIIALFAALVMLFAVAGSAQAAQPVPPGGSLIDESYGCSQDSAAYGSVTPSSTYLHEACALQAASYTRGMIAADGVYYPDLYFVEDCRNWVRYWWGSGGCTPFRSSHTYRISSNKVAAVIYEQDAGSPVRAPQRYACEYIAVFQGSDTKHSLATFPTYYDQNRRCFFY